MEIVDKVIDYWKKQNITIQLKGKDDVKNFLKINDLLLPQDFINFYSSINGMVNLYPNDYDEEGFLFYPLEELIKSKTEFGQNSKLAGDNIVIFGNYMLKCWWYGVRMINDIDYEVIIILNRDTYRVISNSLFRFLELYLKNDDSIY